MICMIPENIFHFQEHMQNDYIRNYICLLYVHLHPSFAFQCRFFSPSDTNNADHHIVIGEGKSSIVN